MASDLTLIPPPTLAPPERPVETPPPIVIQALPSPSPSPDVATRPPVLSGLLPAPEALVPAGPVNIGGRISGAADLAEVTLTVDGAAVQPKITMQDARIWLVAYTSTLDVGKHEARLSAKDRDGRAGGYRWQFDVETRQPTPALPAAPTRRAEATAKPQPTPAPARRADTAASR